MKYNMRLINEAYEAVINGTKRVEIRLLDEKRSKLKRGDTITFTNYDDHNKSFDVVIIDLKTFNNINEVIYNYDISLLLSKETKREDLVKMFNNIYTIDEQNKYNVITIEFILK